MIYTADIYTEFREKYKSKYIITDTVINKIENDDYPILEIRSDHVGFEYSYIYYFFVGMYVAGDESESTVDELCENIHHKENAFILIFTVHHTQNKKLLDIIRKHCVYSFENFPAAELNTSETKFMNALIAILPQSVISDKDTLKNRREERTKKEISLDKQAAEEENRAEDVSIIEINKGMKIIEVLGQILKNRAGSFERQEVIEILESTIDLGLRIMNLFLCECRKPEFKEWLTKLLKDAENDLEQNKNRKFDDEKRIAFIEKSIQFFGYMVTIGMLNKISDSISTEKLITPMAVLSEKKMTPAYEMIDFLVSLSQTGIDIKRVETLTSKYDKSKNYWAEKALSYYVQNFLNTHNVYYKERQRLFAALKLKYLPNKIK